MKFNLSLIPAVVVAFGIAFFVLQGTSCHSNLKRIENKAVVTDSTAPIDTESLLKGDNTFEVHTMAAVFYHPDSMTIDSMLKADRSQVRSEVDTNLRLQSDGVSYLNEKNTKVFITDKRYIVFDNENGRPYVIDTKQSGNKWGLLFYDGEFAPREADMRNIEFEYLQYFAK